MQTLIEKKESVSSIQEKLILDEIFELKSELKNKVYILCHHYQKDNIVQFADRLGDSYGLSKYVASSVNEPVIIFCGVHFMAETADILTPDFQKVILPDLQAGCSMADMADIDQVEECWDELLNITDKKIIPITYVNSTAALKAFCGRNGGAVCTSSNAEQILKWSFEQGDKVLFFPDQHLGRNTAYKMGIPLAKMPIWNPFAVTTEDDKNDYRDSKVILWQGYCSVHMNFRSKYIDEFKKQFPGMKFLVHPECEFETVVKADYVGSTSFIIDTINNAPYGSSWAIGTENHLVERLNSQHPDKHIIPLSMFACQCATMYRIDPEHLLLTMRAIKNNKIINQISVPKNIADEAKIALNRMLEISN